tara:strand:+ start:89 stop:352 length:264 start_codon:yes stop_codon:yes gene_type:complete
LLCNEVVAIITSTTTQRDMTMTTLINKVATKFNVTATSADSVSFSFGEDDYTLTDGTLYATVDGKFLPGFKKVKTLLSVENFVAARC